MSTLKKRGAPLGNKNNLKHGHYQRTSKPQKNPRSRTHNSFDGMISRCHNENHEHYQYYGAKGVTVCERWRGPGGFVNFLNDLGDRPEGMTLDRINPEGNYEPTNCRWLTHKEQAMNKRKIQGPKYFKKALENL